jgi:hypothetical protein
MLNERRPPKGAEMVRLLRCVGLAAATLTGLSWTTPASGAPWCGTPAPADRAPNVVAGSPVRVAYVIPSDGQDRLDELASTLQTDTDTVASWWRTQDPTRTPRFDVARFSCGVQLDIWSVRLRHAGAVLTEAAGRSEAIVNALAALDSRWRYGTYLVYYDGPVADPGVCGAGGSLDEGPGFAIVLVRACRPSVPTATVAAHELIHALGGVPARAPHACPFPSAHTCDDERDIMFPYADGSPLAALVLDPGRNDYYGHSGSWYDVRDSDRLVQLDRQVTFSLTIDGSGSIESDVPGIACTETCTTSWNTGTRLTLTPKPAPSTRFLRWKGTCSTVTTCTLTLERAASATAVFVPRKGRLTTVSSSAEPAAAVGRTA